MFTFRRSLCQVRFILVAMGLTLVAEAGWFDWLCFWSKQDRVQALMITGNYVKSRLLAELIQNKNSQPIIIASPSELGMELYCLPNDPEAALIPPDRYIAFVNQLSPRLP